MGRVKRVLSDVKNAKTIDTFRSEVRSILKNGGISEREIAKILEVKERELLLYYNKGLDAKEALKKIFKVA